MKREQARKREIEKRERKREICAPGHNYPNYGSLVIFYRNRLFHVGT